MHPSRSAHVNYHSVLSAAPIFPTEELLWDPHSVPPGNFSLASNVQSLSLPKLNARFLSAGDYLLRNFHLFRLECAYEIRGDIVDVVKRMRPALKQGKRILLIKMILGKQNSRGGREWVSN